MPIFRSAFSKRQEFHCPSGEKDFPIFEYDDTGELIMTEKKENVFEKIQSFEEEVLLKNIIQRCGLTGETLLASPENFGDSTVLPQTLLEAKQQSQKVQGFVDSLSDEDLDLLNSKGFDDFILAKIAALSANKEVKKESDDNE